MIMCYSLLFSAFALTLKRAPLAQLVKRWPADLAVPSSIPARGEIFSTVNGVQLHTAFSLSSAHRPDMTEILLRKS